MATDGKQNNITISGLMANTNYVFQVRAVFEDQEGGYGPQSDDVSTLTSLGIEWLDFSLLVKKGNPFIYRPLTQESKFSRNPTAKTRKLELGKLFLHMFIRLKAMLKGLRQNFI